MLKTSLSYSEDESSMLFWIVKNVNCIIEFNRHKEAIMNRGKSILVGVLASAVLLTFSGCKERTNSESGESSIVNSQEATNSGGAENEPQSAAERSETIFSDMKLISSIKEISQSDVTLSLTVGNMLSIDVDMSLKGKQDITQLDISGLEITVKQTEDTPSQTYCLKDIKAILDITDKKVYITEESYKAVMAAAGMSLDYDDPAEWIIADITTEDTSGEDSSSSGIVKNIITTTVVPEMTDALKPIQEKFYGENKHTLVLNNNNIDILLDAVISMCDDGSMLNIYKAVDDAGLIETSDESNYPEIVDAMSAPYEITDSKDGCIAATPKEQTPEETIQELRDSLVDAKEQLADSNADAQGTITVKTDVSGDEGAINATITLAADANVAVEDSDLAIECALKLRLVEGTFDIKLPVNSITVEDYQQAIQTYMTEQNLTVTSR